MKNRVLSTADPVMVFTTVISPSVKRHVDVESSQIEWTGKKIAGTHRGTIQLKKGFLNLSSEGKLTSGKFVMNMNSIVVTDLEGEYKEQLEGHLNNDDFFGVENYPTSTLEITEVAEKSGNTYAVTGDLTIKGKTNPVTFELEVNEDTATGRVAIDRTKYGIRYGSGSFFNNLGDKTINNNFNLDVKLKF